jgi:predicted aspartyl protease
MHKLILIFACLSLIWASAKGQTPQGRQRLNPVDIKLPSVSFPAGKSFVEVPFETELNQMIIPVSVNNSRPLRFVFDTGAQGAILFNADAIDTAKLKIVGKVQVRGAGGGANAEASIAEDVTFNIAGLILSGDRMAIAPPGVRPSMGAPRDGAIGRTVFASLVVEVDWETRTIKFYDPAKYKYSGKGATLPLTFDEGGRPYTMATAVIKDSDPIPVKLVVDTGASTALSLDIGSHPGIKQPEGAIKTVLGRGGNGEFTGYVGRVKSLQLGSYAVNDVTTDFPDESQGTAGIGGRQGRLGAGVLRQFKVIYDYSRKQIIFEPNKFLNVRIEAPKLATAPASAVKAAPADLQGYVGRYGNKEISVQDGQLYYQRIGGRGATLRPLAPDTYALNEDARITFVRDAKGTVIEMHIEWRDRDPERISRVP